MELFIQIRDEQPFEHPIFGDNFREAFPHINIENLPPEFAKFERIEQNVTPATFEVAESTYTWVDGIVKDVWTVRPMTAEEETQKRQDLTDGANASVEFMKGMAQQNADSAPSEAAKQAWLDYLVQLNAWTLTDPVNPNIPKPPFIRPDGTVMSTNVSGSEPNVIG
jgi:hypothetical protein